MIPVVANDNSRAGRKLPRDAGKYPHEALTVDDEFEQDWHYAISGNELVQRVHSHIDELYARAEKNLPHHILPNTVNLCNTLPIIPISKPRGMFFSNRKEIAILFAILPTTM
jgi:hypothetical protein